MKYGTIIVVLIAFLCWASAGAQSPVRPEDTESIRRLLASQPDYTATQRFEFFEAIGGFGATSKVVKMGERMAEVRGDTIFIHEPGKPTIKVFPKRKEYSEGEIESDDFNVSPEGLAKRSNTIFKSLGRERVGPYSCLKIAVSFKDERLKEMRFLFWAAPKLKNLVIKSEYFIGQKVKMATELENVSLVANNELFRIPAEYKKIAEPAETKPTP